MKMIEKHFPADTRLPDGTEKNKTFLNDKKIDDKLYAYFQALSRPIQPKELDHFITIVRKKDLPSQKQICKTIHIKSRTTYSNHLAYLISRGYIIDNVKEQYYELPKKEDIFFKIPLDTIEFLEDYRQDVFKTYIYLGQRWNYAKIKKDELYSFTKTEIAKHLGLSTTCTSTLKEIGRHLTHLKNDGLIDYVQYTDQKKIPRMRLINFSTQYITSIAENIEIK